MKFIYFNSLKIASLIFIVYSVVGCKKPESNYILNKYEYSAGEMLLVENLSINDKETRWEVVSPDNEVIQTSEEKNPSLILGILNPDGQYTLKLTSYSRKEKKSSIDEKPFLIKTVRAKLIVNNFGDGDYTDFSVFIDNQLIGTSKYNGQFKANLPVGSRIVRLVAEGNEFNETIVFEENQTEYINF
ncbi:MAG: hypothetical protein ACQERC_11485 [Bacteroidota bacterium]